MRCKTAVFVGPFVLAMAALPARAHAQTRWPVSGNYAPAPGGAYFQSNGLWYYVYSRPAPAHPEADRTAERPAPKPARVPEIVYVNAEGGYQTMSLSSLAATGTLEAGTIRPVSASTSAGGAFYGFGAGIRLGFLTLGGRVRGAHLSVGDLSTIDGELGARITLNRVEPYFTFAGGYAKLAASGSDVAGIPDLNIHGWNARAGLGIDYYADKNFSVGLNFTGDVIAMARPGVDLSTSPETQARDRAKTCESLTDAVQQQQCARNVIHDTEGTSAGFVGTLSVVMGVHF